MYICTHVRIYVYMYPSIDICVGSLFSFVQLSAMMLDTLFFESRLDRSARAHLSRKGW